VPGQQPFAAWAAVARVESGVVTTMTESYESDVLTGLNGFLGFRVVEWRKDYAALAVDLDERHRNRQGGPLHGGVTASLVDAATGLCGVWEPDPDKRRGNATVSLTINFVGRPKGRTLTAAAHVIRAGRRLYFASARVTDEEDSLVATAEAVYAYADRDAQRT
jgi:uncharacterized protein (TIGR00369 family)